MAQPIATGSSPAKQAVRSLFRTFVREQKNTVQPRPFAIRRQDPIWLLENINALLRHARIHESLLARYNPVYGKSEQERIKATANRVGLDVPKEYEHAAQDGLGSSEVPTIDAKYRSR